jgi:hypothetical protein
VNPLTRKRLQLLLVGSLFAAPMLIALVLNFVGWQPQQTRNAGELVQPPQDVNSTALICADGSAFVWRTPRWQWTLLALPGPVCAVRCQTQLAALDRARGTLNQNVNRLRIVLLPAAQSIAIPDNAGWLSAGDPEDHFAALRPSAADSLSAVLVDPNGLLMMRYADGFDAAGLRRDLSKVIR